MILILLACSNQPWPRGEPCDCAAGHGVSLCERDGSCGSCMCLQPESLPDTTDATRAFYVDADVEAAAASATTTGDGSAKTPWAEPDWAAVDDALADGSVTLFFSADDRWDAPLEPTRTGSGDLLTLDGNSLVRASDGSWIATTERSQRAVVPGVRTGFEPGTVVSDVTVRGFEITGSSDKGVQWLAGDRVAILDNVIHDNKGTPAVSLAYSTDTGHKSESFVVIGNHIYSQRGECIYIGGSGGVDEASHDRVVVSDNLVHDCWHVWSNQHDGINIKDRIIDVTVQRNVVFNTDWGIELASPGLVEQNLVFSTGRDGFHVTDVWGLGLSGLQLHNNVVIGPNQAGLYLNATHNHWTDVSIQGLTVIGSAQAGIEFGGESGAEGLLSGLVLVDNAVALDAWSPVGLEVEDCLLYGNDLDADREWSGANAQCETRDPDLGDRTQPSGPDLLFFTPDDVGAPAAVWPSVSG